MKTSYETYKQYLALNLHFSKSTYDYFKYNKTTKASIETFNKRPDKYFFEKLSKNFSEQEIEYVLLYFIEFRKPKLFIKDWFTHINEYHEWKRKLDALNYFYEIELSKITNLKSFLSSFENMVYESQRNGISFEIMTILFDTLPWKVIPDNEYFKSVTFRMKKLIPFLHYNKKKILESTRNMLYSNVV